MKIFKAVTQRESKKFIHDPFKLRTGDLVSCGASTCRIDALSVCIFLVLFLHSNKLISQSSKQYNIQQYGAVSNGTTLNTEIIQKAINTASENGGGVVVIPKGKFLTGSLEMKSNVSVYLQKGAVLLGSTDPFQYKEIHLERGALKPKNDDNASLALFVAYRADNISIAGPGTVDGQGRALAINIDSLYHLGIIKDPNYSSWANRPNEKIRPKLVRFSTCDYVKIEEATLMNSASWGLSFELCNNLVLDKLVIINLAYWNNDGMDITDCKNVQVTNCDINSADDGICLKSYYPGRTNDSVLIANCTVRSGASAIKFGTASYGGFKNVTINNIKVFDTYRSAIAIECVDGGTIENIRATNIVAKNTGNAIFIRLGNRAEGVGQLKNIYIGNMKVQVPFIRPDINYDLRAHEPAYTNPISSSITGIPGHKVKDITIENVEITYPGRATKGQAYFPLSRLKDFPEKIKEYPEFSMFGEMPAWAFYVRHADNITMRNITLKLAAEDFRPAFVFDDANNIDMEKIKLPRGYQYEQIILRNNEGFSIKESGDLEGKKID
ncbi:MAG: glycosyl hydrolase family 28 protein [Niabella sp.]